MTPSLLLVLVAAIAVLALVFTPIGMYNRFVRQRQLIEESWGGIDVELTRRHDLIPALVRTVQAYAAHEQSVLTALTQARETAAAHRQDPPKAREGLEDALTGAVGQVLARVEAYPDLKASGNVLQLQRQLTLTEDRIAGMFGFEPREFFELQDPGHALPPTATV